MTVNMNPQMITLARESRGITQAELAELIGMSPTNLSKIERSDVGIAEEALQSIANETKYLIGFFKQSGEIVPENLNYRKREVVAQKLITPIHARANIIRRHVRFLTTALDVTAPVIPTMEVTEKQTPAKIADKLRQTWKADTPVIKNFTQMLEDKGIVISTFPFGTDRIDSRTILTDERFPIIFLNNSLQGDRQRFSLAYELGQLIMHTFSIVPANRNVAREASAFAAAFLMPAKEILEDFKEGVSIPVLGELKRKWKVSMIALLYRADDLGLLTPNQKRYLLQQFNQLKIRRREPIELDVPKEKPRLMRQWISEYRRKTKLGVADIAVLFCLYIDEFMELYA